MYIASQIVVAIADLLFITSLQLKNRKSLLFVQIFSCALFALQYMLLFAWVGFACAMVEVLRIIVFYFLDKKPNQKHYIIASAVLTVFVIVTTIVGWEAWYSIIPFIGVVSVNICLAQKNLLVLKYSYTLQSTCYTIYMFLIKSYVGAILEIIVTLGGLIASAVEFARSRRAKKLTQDANSLSISTNNLTETGKTETKTAKDNE